MKDITRMGIKKERGCTIGLVVTGSKESSRMTGDMGEAFCIMQVEESKNNFMRTGN